MCGNQSLPAFVDCICLRLLCPLIIAFILLLCPLTNANCSHQFFFHEDDGPKNSADERPHQNISWTFVEDTKQCNDELALLFSSNGSFTDPQQQQQQHESSQQSDVSPCVDQLLDIELTPLSVFPVGQNVLPHVQLNISVNTFSSVDQLFFRFRCIYAPNSDDYLCHDHSIQLKKWGQMIWPCRTLRINRKQLFPVPQFHFSYTCFRLFSLSQYSIEFFVLNRNEFCRRELIFTIPMEQQLDPKISDFYKTAAYQDHGTALVAPSWSPLVALDTSFSDCLFVQLHASEWLTQSQQQFLPKTVDVTVFSAIENSNDNGNAESNDISSRANAQHRRHNETANDYQRITVADDDHRSQSADNSHSLASYKQKQRQSHQHFLLSHKVPFLGRNEQTKKQNNFYRWAWIDVDAGNYTLFAFVEQGDCHLTCPHWHQKCRVCPHTALNFTLNVAKHSAEWHSFMFMASLARNANFCVLGILFFLLIALVVAFLYVRVWRPRALARLPPHHVELDGRCPTVLVLYTDDCQEHSDAVLTLCRTLEECANAKCFVDQWEFVANPTLRPSLWLVDKLAECDFVLVIFSACSARVMGGDRLVQRLHFPDLFNSGLGFIVARIHEIASSEGVILPEQYHHQNGHLHSLTNFSGQKTVPAKHCQGVSSVKSAANDKSLLNRFIFARFACADPSVIPPFFASSQFGVGPLVLPDQIGLLIARLHGIVDTIDTTTSSSDSKGRQRHRRRFLHEADLSQLNASLERLRQFVETNPNWMEQRFINSKTGRQGGEEDGEENGQSNEENGVANTQQQQQLAETGDGTVLRQIRVPTFDEQAQIAERYGLLAVEDGEVGEEEDKYGQKRIMEVTKGANGKRYQLLMTGEVEEEEEVVEVIDEYGDEDDDECGREARCHGP